MSGYLLDMRPRGVGGGGSSAPVDATYITQTPNATLTNEQALSLLATGLLKNTTATGVLSIATPTVDFASAAQGALADTSLQPGDIGVTVQSWDADLDTLAALAKIKGNLIAGTGATWQALPVGADGLALVADSLEATGLKWAAIVAGVSSVFGRTGAVVAALNDYPASFITNTPAGGIASTDVQGALNELDTEKAAITSLATVAFSGAYGDLLGLPTLGTMAAFNDAPSDGSTYGRNNGAWASVVGGVSSVFARTGAVVSANGDYTASQVTNVPAGNIAAVTVQAALNELDTEKAGLALANIFTLGPNEFRAGADGNKVLIAKRHSATQSANIFEIQDQASGALVSINPVGNYAAYNPTTTNFTSHFDFGYAVTSKVQLGFDATAGYASFDINMVPPGATPGRIRFKRNGTVFYTLASNTDVQSTIGYSVGAAGSSTIGYKIGYSETAAIPAFAILYNSSAPGRAFFSVADSFGDGLQWRYESSASKIFAEVNTTGNHIWRALTAVTNSISYQTITHSSTGTPLVGFGTGLKIQGKSSTTADQDMARLTVEWATATHASRKALSKWTVYDTAEREGIRIEADGSNPMIGFLGKTAIARPTTYTLASTATRTMPTPEAAFTGQDNAQAGSVYAKSADIITLQTRLNNVEGVLRQLIVDLASTSGYGLLVAS